MRMNILYLQKMLSTNDFSFYWSSPSENHSFWLMERFILSTKMNLLDLSNLDEQLKIYPSELVLTIGILLEQLIHYLLVE